MESTFQLSLINTRFASNEHLRVIVSRLAEIRQVIHRTSRKSTDC
jgi:hypothetical protein